MELSLDTWMARGLITQSFEHVVNGLLKNK